MTDKNFWKKLEAQVSLDFNPEKWIGEFVFSESLNTFSVDSSKSCFTDASLLCVHRYGWKHCLAKNKTGVHFVACMCCVHFNTLSRGMLSMVSKSFEKLRRVHFSGDGWIFFWMVVRLSGVSFGRFSLNKIYFWIEIFQFFSFVRRLDFSNAIDDIKFLIMTWNEAEKKVTKTLHQDKWN